MKKTRQLVAGLLLLLTCSLGSSAQYGISPIPPPPNFTFNDLWHFTVTRSGADAYTQFYVALRIHDGKNMLKVKTNSTTFALDVGSRYYNLANINLLQPFGTGYYDAGILQEIISGGGQFPPGSYNITYTLYGKAKDGEFTPLAEEALQTTVEVMWPPILLWPEDKAVLADHYPVLTWTPAFSSSFTGTILYDLKLVELSKGQSAEQAILSNPRFFDVSKLGTTSYPYTSEAPALKDKTTYAWQVKANLGGIWAPSQVWQFTFSQDDPLPTGPPSQYYTPVLEKLDGGFAMAVNYELKLKYTEEYELPSSGNNYLIYNIYDQNGIKIRTSLPPMSSPSATIKKGDNYISLALGNPGLNLTAGQFYIIEVMNHKNEKWYLRFQVVRTGLPD